MVRARARVKFRIIIRAGVRKGCTPHFFCCYHFILRIFSTSPYHTFTAEGPDLVGAPVSDINSYPLGANIRGILGKE